MNTPIGGSPAMATTPITRPQPRIGWLSVSPVMSWIFCEPLAWAIWPTAKKIAALVRLCIVMCSSPAKLASVPTQAEGEGDDAHVLNRGIGEEPLDVVAAVEHERREHDRQQAHRDHQRPGRHLPPRWPRAAS